ncbi:MAG: bifunctional UDP-sugar hydrolase/5'-nucleotidase [Candidatus Sericytochromatia bacterium]|nr:bifunctional UDP-sugar hydrolase/5'-nucleotidase [Candidatus Sericytochromatia bacterium]
MPFTMPRHPGTILLAGLLAVTALAGCGSPSQGYLPSGNRALRYRANSIPVTPGAPELGQVPELPVDPTLAGQPVPFSVLYTSDIHSRIEPFADDYYYATYAGKGGMARLATKANELRSRQPQSVLVDSGDYLQGTPYFNFFKGEAEMRLLGMVGFSALTIGNHEFDNGVDDLRRAMGFYNGRPITSNVTFNPEFAGRYTVVKAGRLRVGIFGLLTEVDGLIAPPNFQSATYYDPLATARVVVEKLRREADVVVCISHVGTVPPWADEHERDHADEHAADAAAEGPRVTDEMIAAKVPGIDVLVSGHTHVMIKRPKVYETSAGRCLIVSPGFGAGFLGKLDLTLRDGKIEAYQNDLIPLDRTIRPDPTVEAAIAPYKAKVDSVVKEVIGVAAGDFKRYATGAVESSLNNLIADASLAAARVIDPAIDFAISSSGTPRNHILHGQIRIEDAFYALPFDNKLAVMTVDGKTARDMLRIQRRPNERKRHAVAGVTYMVQANGEITSIRVGGRAFDESRTYKVVVTDYMAEGGAGFAMLPGKERRNLQVLQRDALIAYIRAKRQLTPEIGRILSQNRP